MWSLPGRQGSGKSSLVRAGLIHALKQGALPASQSDRWLCTTLTPGRGPLESLALAIAAPRQVARGEKVGLSRTGICMYSSLEKQLISIDDAIYERNGLKIKRPLSKLSDG